MKKIIYILLAAIVILPSCLKDDKDIFDDSSANRMSKALEEYQKVLESKPNGWLMSYYPGRESSSEVKAGYNYLVKFKEGRVTAALDYDIVDYNVPGNTGVSYPSGTEVSSFFKMIGDEGPILSFDTNNALLHYFCSPTSDDPYASYGDYEFTVISASSDSIVLKGKRYRNKIIMTPIPEGETWSQCLDNIENIRSIINNSVKECFMYVDNKEVPMTKLARAFTLEINDGSTTENVTIAYRCLEDGIQFFKPINVHGKYVQNFKYADGKFKCTDEGASDVVIELKDMPFFKMQLTITQWVFERGDLSPALQTIWDNVSNSLPASYYAPLDIGYVGISHHSSVSGYALAISTQRYWGLYSYKYTFGGDSNANEFSLQYVGDGLNGSAFKSYFNPLLNAFSNNAPYTLTTDSYTNPTYIHFESKANPNIYFTAYQ